jgi:PPK2 family polyphosphate:nucleotide phosphotransferase
MNFLSDKRIRVEASKKFNLDSFQSKLNLDIDKKAGRIHLEELNLQLQELQDKLYAQDRYSLLIIFQAMDAAGKDGTIKTVFSGINPQGCHVVSFKKPTAQELDHDFMWRCYKELPERGRMGIFNRSYYEEVLVTKVHPEYILGQRIPGIQSLKDINSGFWEQRYKTIRDFESHLIHNGTIVLKFFLNVSRDAQKERFLERIETPEKNWKFSYLDLQERKHWDDYRAAYSDLIRNTSTPEAPWYIVPADSNWSRNLIVSSIIAETLDSLGLSYPKIEKETMELLLKGKAELLNEKPTNSSRK